ncbi:MAG: copper-translocating P-type ATPase [Bacilli bacterium]|nr:copper-translocating P-type ATPase [Bacilli bacterium]
MKKVILKIDGMTCSACSSGLEKYLNKQSGIKANVNLVLSQALIEYEDNISIQDINKYIKDAGFESLGVYNPNEKRQKNRKISFSLFSILAFIILYISMAPMLGFPSIPFLNINKFPERYAVTLLLLTLPFFFFGKDIFISGARNLIHKTPNMDTLVSIGVIASFLYSLFGTIMIFYHHTHYVHHLYFESAAIVIYFIKLGRFIDKKSKEKTGSAIKELVQITPTKALLKIENDEKEVSIDEVKVNDILIAKPGMKIAVDGIIISGITHVEEAFITGESTPVKKQENDKVVAGSINLDGYILYKALKIGKQSTISEIVKLVVEATNTKAPIAHLADKVSLYFVPSIVAISLLTFFLSLLLKLSFSDSLTSFVNVLVVACPCALGLATPLAMVISVGMCAKQGILIKQSKTLEQAHKINTIVFDKTGTLTYGNMKIEKILLFDKYSEIEVLKYAASLENHSSHPISKAFIEEAQFKKILLQNVTNFKSLPGIGLSGIINGKNIFVGNYKLFSNLNIKNIYEKEEQEFRSTGSSIVYVVINQNIVALIGINDIVRKSSKNTISKLKQLGKEVIMLTGDNHDTANKIGNKIGIPNIIANVMPAEKVSTIKNLMKSGKKVMMIGDGINDAPSLASADIGVSVSNGTDIAANSSDVILMNDNLEKIISLLIISNKTIKIIKQNLFWAFFYNVCMIPIAAGVLVPFGIHMNPMIAGFAMMISSFTVILNSLRLKNISLI